MRHHDELEVATMPAGERARQYARGERQAVAGPLLAREIRLIKSGARTCDTCRHRAGSVATGDPRHLTVLCEDCARSAKLDRQAEAQQARLAAMKSRA